MFDVEDFAWPDTRAILLLAHGTPGVLGEMSDYLSRVTGGRTLPEEVITELQHRYAAIGLRDEPLPDGPPLTRWTIRQGNLLAEALGLRVYVGMRNWHPFIADVVEQMRADGITSIKAICLAPQNSRTSVGLYRRALMSAAAGLEVDFVAGWADHPLLIQAFAENLWPIWAEACAASATRIPVIFTAHSVPCRTIMTGGATSGRPGMSSSSGQHSAVPTGPDPYPVEAKRTASLVAQRLAVVGFRETDWYFAFQSQGISGGPWIGPTVEETLKALKEEGHTGVVIQPIGFLCDHVEILYDIDIAFRQTARDLGLKLWRADSLNDSPTLIEALAQLASSSTPSSQPQTLAAISAR